MFEYIKSLFIKKKSKNKASIYFDLDDTNNISIFIDYNTDDNNIGQQIGRVLFLLNKGLLMQPIMDHLDSLKKQKNHNNVVMQILESWNNYYIVDDFNEPVIKPIGAFAKNVK